MLLALSQPALAPVGLVTQRAGDCFVCAAGAALLSLVRPLQPQLIENSEPSEPGPIPQKSRYQALQLPAHRLQQLRTAEQTRRKDRKAKPSLAKAHEILERMPPH